MHFDEDPEFKKQALSSVVKLQGNDPEAKKIWLDICEASRKGLLKGLHSWLCAVAYIVTVSCVYLWQTLAL